MAIIYLPQSIDLVFACSSFKSLQNVSNFRENNPHNRYRLAFASVLILETSGNGTVEPSGISTFFGPSMTRDSKVSKSAAPQTLSDPPAMPSLQQEHVSGGQLSTHDVNGTSVVPDAIPETSPSKVLYRVEYKNKDGEIVLSREEEDPEKLLPKVTLSTVLEVLTIINAPTSKKASDVASSTKATTKAAPSASSSDQSKEETTKTDLFSSSDSQSKEEKNTAVTPEGFERNFTTETQIIIRSEKLLNALRAVIRYLPNKTLIGRDISFPEPYQPLIHHRAELEAYKNQHPPEHSEEYRRECNEHIDILLNHLSDTCGKAIEAEKDRHARDPPVCTFEYLWLLFKPGEACYCKEVDGNIKAYITSTITGGIVRGVPKKYQITYWNVDFDGWEVGQESYYESVLPFDGEKEIRSLTYYPCTYHQDDPKDLEKSKGIPLRERLISNGKRWWQICLKTCKDRHGSVHVDYDGNALSPPYKKVSGRQVIDPLSYFGSILYVNVKSYILERPTLKGDESNDQSQGQGGSSGCACSVCNLDPARKRLDKFRGYHKIDPRKDDAPNDPDFFFLCTHRLFCFQLKERYWDALNVENIREVEANNTAFDNLVLDPTLKSTIEALSRSFTRAESKQSETTIPADLIKGKGEGRVFLLHGPPGVGKTATAEAIAEMTGRPLLALTCGDLGTVAKDVEANLSKYMFYGENWGAVVLLDEADIYLERRSVTDIKRNGLVSVFLRALEYYKGLLFLTTNRVNTFDEAFTSRIHVSLHYKKLTDSDRAQIWVNSIARLHHVNVKVTKQAKEYVCGDQNVSRLQWNGREIRNALQTAVALADFKAPDRGENPLVVRQEHLREVVNLSGQFKRYMEREHGGQDASTVAKRQGLRNDNFGELPKRSSKFSSPAAPPKPLRKSARDEEVEEDDDEDEEEVQLPRKAKSKMRMPAIVEPKFDDGEDEKYLKARSTRSKELKTPKRDEGIGRREGSKTKKSTKPISSMYEEEEDEYPPSKSKAKRSKSERSEAEEKEEESEEVEEQSSSRRPTKMSNRSASPSKDARRTKTSSRRQQQVMSVEEEEDESEEESEEES